jgi:hypothetical protein
MVSNPCLMTAPSEKDDTRHWGHPGSSFFDQQSSKHMVDGLNVPFLILLPDVRLLLRNVSFGSRHNPRSMSASGVLPAFVKAFMRIQASDSLHKFVLKIDIDAL